MIVSVDTLFSHHGLLPFPSYTAKMYRAVPEYFRYIFRVNQDFNFIAIGNKSLLPRIATINQEGVIHNQ
jgi:hypothetical protein